MDERAAGAPLVVWPATALAQPEVAQRAAEVLGAGGLVVYPTDTVYGLGAKPDDPAAIRRIYEVKGRPDEKAIIWLVTEADAVREWCEVDARAERLAAQFWPGGLTLVLRRRNPPTGALGTLGVRVPAHPAALAIIAAAGGRVATTSANRSGEPSARSADEAAATIGPEVDLIVDAGPAPGGTESTVLDLTGDQALVLRAGAVSAEELESILTAPVRRPG
ncbi:MAG: L-threonylcarbamoyladenylate synthase [Chloroflexota bacterium]|nr:L-threonylcarbamoyladenylate synthase [Chloroflexota bacterium]